MSANQVKWEYVNVYHALKTGIFSGKDRGEYVEQDITQVMNYYGVRGWELVGIYWNHVHAGIVGAIMTFKRPRA